MREYTKIFFANTIFYIWNGNVPVKPYMPIDLLDRSDFAIRNGELIKCRYGIEDVLDEHLKIKE